MATKKTPAKKPTTNKATARKPAATDKKASATAKKAATKPAATNKKPCTTNKTPAAKPVTNVKKNATTKAAPTKKPASNKNSTATVRKPVTKKQSVNNAQRINITTTPEGLVTVEIRRHRDSQGGHPHVMVDKVQGKEVSVGLTTKKKKGKNSTSTNKKLKVNPLGGNEPAYMRRQATVDDSAHYSGKQKGKMHPDDHKKAKEYAYKAKKKHLDKKKK